MATVCTPKIKRAQSAKSMGFCLNYVKDRRKTEMASGKVLVSGVRCQPELAYQQFMLTKALAGKTEGRMYYHYVQSFKPDENLSPEHAHKIALELADYFQGFEVVVSTHMDRAHLHSHLIINSVSQETGNKLHLDNKSIFRIRDYSDGLCLNHGLSVLKKSEPNYRIKSMSRGEYRASLRGETVKGSLMRTINEAMRNCNSKDEFTKFMEDKGYEVKWTDSRKNITYTCPDGLKVRDDNLHDERFLKENMQLEFDYRQTKVKEKDTGWEFTHRQEERTINNISEAGPILLNLAKSVSKMTEDNKDDEDLQGFMTLTAVGVVVAIELAKRLMEIPEAELNYDKIQATVEEHKMMQDEMDAEIEDEIDDGMEGKVVDENGENIVKENDEIVAEESDEEVAEENDKDVEEEVDEEFDEDEYEDQGFEGMSMW